MMQSRQSGVVVGPAGAPFHRRRGEGCARALLSFGGSATPISLPTLLVPSCGAFIRYECCKTPGGATRIEAPVDPPLTTHGSASADSHDARRPLIVPETCRPAGL